MNKKYLFGTLGCAVIGTTLYAADHGDTPQLISISRHDARISDHHAWRQGNKFVMSLCTNPAIPVGVTSYTFPEDLTMRLHIDNKADVDFSETTPDSPGRIKKPKQVKSRITFEFSSDENGNLDWDVDGLNKKEKARVQVFSGLRDDPFINGDATNVTPHPTNRVGRNSACIVIQMPLDDIRGNGSNGKSLLTWATTKVPDVDGPIQEHAGRALKSQVVVFDQLNSLEPRAHWTEFGIMPDVMIHNLNAPSGYPNGRKLTDDVIDLVVDTRGLAGNPFGNPNARDATENDKPFLADFPYLAAPH